MNAATVALFLTLTQVPGQNAAPAVTPPQEAPVVPGALPPAPTTKLTLEEALREAEVRNVDIRAAEARLHQADEASTQAWSYYLPHVSVSGNYTRNEVSTAFPVEYLAMVPANDFTGSSPPYTITDLSKLQAVPLFGTKPLTLVPLNQFGAELDVNQAIFAPSLWYAIKGAKSSTDVAKASTENARRAIRFGTAQAFYAVASLAKSVSVNERLLEIAQRAQTDAEVRFRAGTIAKVGLLRAQITRSQAEQDLKRARNSYESGRLTLAILLDRPVDFEVVEPPEPVMPVDPTTYEDRALSDRSDVKAARFSVDAAYADRDGNVANYFPTLGAFFKYQASNAEGFNGLNEYWTAGLNLSWNIFDGLLRESKTHQLDARIDEQRANLAKAELTARQEVRQALLDLDSARANASKASEQRDLAAENERLIDVSYGAGASTAVEQADASAQLRNAEFNLQVEALSAELATLRVVQVIGARGPDAK